MRNVFLLIGITAMSIFSLLFGASGLVLRDIFDPSTISHTLFMNSRVPRTVTLLLVGFGLSIAGYIFQQISRNRFVSPSTSGAINGAQLGIALSIVLFAEATITQQMILGLIFAMLTTLMFMSILERLKFNNVILVPLIGLMIGQVINSITTLIAYRFDFLQVIDGWFLGSFSLVISGRYEFIYVVFISIFLAFLFAKRFTIAGMGKDFSIGLGLDYRKTVNIGLFLISLICVCVVLVAGEIPFVGLIIPNIVAIYAGENLEKNLLEVGLMGSLFMLICDIISRAVIFPYEVPISLTVGVIGGAIFLALIFTRKDC